MRRWVTRDYSGSEDGLEERHAPLDHRLGESDRLREESSARRSGDPERGLALQFNRFRNPYGAAREERKTTLYSPHPRTRKSLCEMIRKLSVMVSRHVVHSRGSRRRKKSSMASVKRAKLA